MLLRNCLILLCVAASCHDGFAKEEQATPGLEIGAEAPGFDLLNQSKEKVKLAALLKQGPVAIVFHRSAQW